MQPIKLITSLTVKSMSDSDFLDLCRETTYDERVLEILYKEKERRNWAQRAESLLKKHGDVSVVITLYGYSFFKVVGEDFYDYDYKLNHNVETTVVINLSDLPEFRLKLRWVNDLLDVPLFKWKQVKRRKNKDHSVMSVAEALDSIKQVRSNKVA